MEINIEKMREQATADTIKDLSLKSGPYGSFLSEVKENLVRAVVKGERDVLGLPIPSDLTHDILDLYEENVELVLYDELKGLFLPTKS